MSEIITLQHRHYIGTAVEIVGITGHCGDTAYSTDTDVYYSWGGSAWVVGGEPFFVERLTGATDFDKTAFITDGNPHVNGLDLSAIRPPGAIAVRLKTYVLDDAAGSYLQIYRDAVNTQNMTQAKTHVANVSDQRVEEVSIDTDGFLDYQASNVVFTTIFVTVLGWWMRRCL